MTARSADPTAHGSDPGPGGDGLPAAGPAASGLRRARRAEQLAQLLQRASALANESADTDTAFGQAVRDMCETMVWPAGQALTLGEVGQLRPAGPVHLQDRRHARSAERLDEIAATGGHPADQVVASGQAVWIRDLDADGQDADAARQDATGWLGFPVIADGDVVAVLQFISDEESEPDEDFLQTVGAIGRQLGVLVERNQARAGLENLNEELERSNRELEQFAYVASHDLQEPLRKIVGFAELLVERYGDQFTGEAAEFLGYVIDGAHRMRQLIQDLLAYSRAGRRRPHLGPVELAEVADAAIADLQTAVEESGSAVTVEDPLPRVHGNASELRELLVNLLSNALKYRSDSDPRITVRAARQPDGWWRLTVADNGIGIAPDQQQRIFEIFQRLHGQGRYEGTGIGLAICTQITNHHGGRLWVESTPGEGSAFHLTLPPAAELSENSDG